MKNLYGSCEQGRLMRASLQFCLLLCTVPLSRHKSDKLTLTKAPRSACNDVTVSCNRTNNEIVKFASHYSSVHVIVATTISSNQRAGEWARDVKVQLNRFVPGFILKMHTAHVKQTTLGDNSIDGDSSTHCTFPVTELRDTVRLILDMLWLQAAHVFRTMRLHDSKSSTYRRPLEGKKEFHAEPAALGHSLRDALAQSSKYAVLSALHMSRCPTCRSEVLAATATVAAALRHDDAACDEGSGPGASKRDIGAAELARIATGLVVYFREAFVLGLVAEDADAAASNDELLGVALKALPGCFVVDDALDDSSNEGGAGDVTFLRILCPRLLLRQSWAADKSDGFARCQDEWSRATMPQLAVSMSVTQFALMTRDKRVAQQCLRRWASRRQRRLSKREGIGASMVNRYDGQVAGSAKGAVPKRVSFQTILREISSAASAANPQLDATVCNPALPPNNGRRHDDNDLATQRRYFHQWRTMACDAYVKEDRRRHRTFLLGTIVAMQRRRRIRRLRHAEQQKLLRVAFELWRDVFVRLERSERSLTAAARLRTLGSVFRRWRAAWLAEEVARRHAQCQTKLELLSSVKALERTRQVLVWWRQQALVARFRREVCARQCLQQWRRSLRFVVHLRSCGPAAVPVLVHPSAAAALCDSFRAKCATWRQWVRAWNARRAERVYVAKVFACWQRKVSVASRLRAAEGALRIGQQRRQLRAVLRWWYRAWSVALPLCLEASHMANQFRRRVLLTRWRMRANRLAHQRTALRTLRRDKEASLRAALWQRWRTRATVHRAFSETRRMRRQNFLRSVFTRWSHRLWLVGILRDESNRVADEKYRRTCLQAALSRWRVRWYMAELERVRYAEHVADELADRTAKHWMLRRCLALWFGKWVACRMSSSSALMEPAVAATARGTTTTAPATGNPAIRGLRDRIPLVHRSTLFPFDGHPAGPRNLNPTGSSNDVSQTRGASTLSADDVRGGDEGALASLSNASIIDVDSRVLLPRGVRHRHASMPIASARAHLFVESSLLRKNVVGPYYSLPIPGWSLSEHGNRSNTSGAGEYTQATAPVSFTSARTNGTPMVPSSEHRFRNVSEDRAWEQWVEEQSPPREFGSDIEIEMVDDEDGD